MDELMQVFRQTYLEESFEGLAAMESNLLTLPEGTPDTEVVNTIFRAAHSMKGGAGTFGFSELIHLTHILETLLDEMRSGKRNVTSENREALLQSVDVLRIILDAYQDNQPIDMTPVKAMEQRLEAILNHGAQSLATTSNTNNTATDQPELIGYQIHLSPSDDYFTSGIDLLKLLHELSRIEGAERTHIKARLNEGNPLQVEHCLISFNVVIDGEVELADINEVFEWLDEDSCHISISPIYRNGDSSTGVTVEASTATSGVVVATEAPTALTQQTAVTATAPAATNNGAPRAAVATGEKQESSIRVSISKIDQMVDMVGELVIAQSMLSRFGLLADQLNAPWADELKEGLVDIERHTRAMQESVMSIRMMPISFAFNRMPRIVHDVSAKLEKDIELVMEGENTEVDKTVLEKLTDPLVHIIRNSVDHGIEKPDVREAKGKARKGTVRLSAFHAGGNIVIQIKDDGAGIRLDKVRQKAIDAGILTEHQVITEKENIDLIFHAGFSTADEVTDISGRGVGMDVVRRNIRELGGTIEVQTEQNLGSIFTIRLPLTLAILDGQLAKVGDETYIFPLASIVESVLPAEDNIKSVKGTYLYRLRDVYIPIVRLNTFFNRPVGKTELTQGLLVVVENGDKRFGVFVDSLESQQQVVIKSLDTNYRKVNGISGATIMGDGRVAMILDLTELSHEVE
ncbi:MAG: chemotaxis protein CheA [Thiotrichales bacterium 32-46-8]|nr:MAG: chemotaxis protein CheA [Thiotrichales bacterium 32-46-8]OYY24982.1 MAG: chemotaxis protein CheA [Thiotrichales bacterium 35-46-9]OYZ09877.1 MAG: chemotaxis protein CheA [Thiotrichales bacterium 16-46-22]OZA20428.1 MAG: chemotaxis protein CheA [Thiotrichales bacterium 17-46-47]OZA74977.1 MAG: chemotaxis protein CheA [Thiotrichales bacterium 39-47-5]OZA97535.1 MAG: chemotaxis protein CheA [Thiotrichales bacterium 34-46-19]HQR81359.1 chemotaxis protein CheA [Thiotrichales bacterium]